MAITAWSAKVETSSICLSVNGRTVSSRQIEHPDWDTLPYQRYSQDGANASTALDRLGPGVFRVGADVGNMNSAPLKRRSPDQRVAPRFD